MVRKENLMSSKKSYQKSLESYKKAKELIPNQSQTLSKSPSQFVVGKMPLFSKRAEGCKIWDVDGNEYIDYMGALGPIVLGYKNPVVDEAIIEQLKDGIIFSQPHPLEIDVVELLTEIIPCAEMARFCKNGSDATEAAVRIARAYTGKSVVLYCGYHGFHDWYAAATERNRGVLKILKDYVQKFEYNNIKSLKNLFGSFYGKVAAIIMEPVYAVKPENNFLEKVKELTGKNGALFIFDEIITGFRWTLGGAQEYFGVIPDLACFGKSMANGMPVACVVGKKEIMKECEDVFLSSTYGGECLSLAASYATINFMKNNNVIPYLWKMGGKLQGGIEELILKYELSDYVECAGFPPRPVMRFYDGERKEWLGLKTLFQQYMVDSGILYTSYFNMTYSHTDAVINGTLKKIDFILERIQEDIFKKRVELKAGDTIKPVFR